MNLSTLQEKIEKFQKGLHGYKTDKLEKNPQLAHNLALITGCFEFECYLYGGEGRRSTTHEQYKFTLSDYSGKECEIILDDYFSGSHPMRSMWRSKALTWLREYEDKKYHDNYNDYFEEAENKFHKEGNHTPTRDEIAERAYGDYITRKRNLQPNDIIFPFPKLSEIVDALELEPDEGYTIHDGALYELEEAEPDDIDYEFYYQRFAKRIQKVFNTHAEVENVDFDTKMEHPDWWFVEEDGSVCGHEPDEDYVGVEFTSEWVKSSDAIGLVKKFKKDMFDAYTGITNSRCGFHFNLRTKGIIINPVKLLMLLGEDKELRKYDRKNNRYAMPLVDPIMDKLRSEASPPKLKQLITFIEDNIRKDKFFSVNFGDYNFDDGTGRVEFRIMGGDYLGDKYDLVLESIPKYIYLVAASCEPEAYYKDYLLTTNRLTKQLKKDDPGYAVNRCLSTLENDYNHFMSVPTHQIQISLSNLTNAISNKVKSGSPITFSEYGKMYNVLRKLNRYINVSYWLNFLPHTNVLDTLKKVIKPREGEVYELYNRLHRLTHLDDPKYFIRILRDTNERYLNEIVEFIISHFPTPKVNQIKEFIKEEPSSDVIEKIKTAFGMK